MIKAMLLKTLLVAAVASSLSPVAASAGEVQNRLNNQQARLNQGVRSGQLTRREYNHLDRRDDSIQAQRNRDLRNNDGHLTPAEYQHLNNRLNNTSDATYFDKHNYQRQTGTPRR